MDLPAQRGARTPCQQARSRRTEPARAPDRHRKAICTCQASCATCMWCSSGTIAASVPAVGRAVSPPPHLARCLQEVRCSSRATLAHSATGYSAGPSCRRHRRPRGGDTGGPGSDNRLGGCAHSLHTPLQSITRLAPRRRAPATAAASRCRRATPSSLGLCSRRSTPSSACTASWTSCCAAGGCLARLRAHCSVQQRKIEGEA